MSFPTPRWPYGLFVLLLGCGILLTQPCRGEEPQRLLVQAISAPALATLLGQPGTMSFGESGTRVEFATRPGLCHVTIGVYPSLGEAQATWTRRTVVPPTTEAAHPNVGDQRQLVLIRDTTDDEETACVIAFRRDNVCCQVSWEGDTDEATAFAQKLDKAIMHDATFAPRAAAVTAANIEVVAPALASSGTAIPIMYRTRPVQNVCLVPFARNAIDGIATMSQVPLTEEPLTLPAGRQSVSLSRAGIHRLTLTFVTEGSVIVTRPLTIRVLTPEEQTALSDRHRWTLLENVLYLRTRPDGNWHDLPATEKEQLSLTRKTFEALKLQPEAEEHFLRIKAWNELVDVLRLEWLPPRDMLTIMEDTATPMLHRVAYAAYTCRDARVVVMSVIGKRTSIYIETANAPQTVAPALTDILTPTLTAPVKTFTQDRIGYAANTFQRYRALTPDGPVNAVSILLIQATRPEGLTLRPSGYRENW